jgi:hypothetical protein
LLIEPLAVCQAIKFNLGKFNLVDDAPGNLLNITAAHDQFLVDVVSHFAALFQLLLEVVELLLYLVESFAIKAQAGEESVAANCL